MPGDAKKPKFQVSRKPPAVATQPLRMPEPVHRIPPGGVTSAASVRSIPKSCVQSVKDICMFYVDKVAGQYHDHPAAARYVHQMAEEVILQLSGVASEIKKNRGEPEMYAQLLAEWEEHFPASLGAVGTPKAVAASLQQHARDLQRLRSELEHERLHRDADVSGILRSMDAQLHAYRASVLQDRRQAALLHEADLAACRDRLESAQRLHNEAIQQVQDLHRAEVAKKRASFERQAQVLLAQKQRELRRLSSVCRAKLQQRSARIAQLQERVIDQRLALTELRRKYHALARSFNETVALSDSDCDDDDDDNDSALADDLDLDLDLDLDDDEEEEEEEGGHEGGREGRSRGSSLSSHPFDDTNGNTNATGTGNGNSGDRWETYLKRSSSGKQQQQQQHQQQQHQQGEEEEEEGEVLQALRDLARDRQQRRALRQQQRLQQQQEQQQQQKDKGGSSLKETRRQQRLQQRDRERQDMQSFSAAVLAGDLSTAAGSSVGRSKSVGGNKSTNNNNNNGNNGNNKALSAKLLTLSATNRKLEQRCQRNEALLQRMARDRDAVLAQVRRLGEERGLLLKRLQEENGRNEALRRALGGQLVKTQHLMRDKAQESSSSSSSSSLLLFLGEEDYAPEAAEPDEIFQTVNNHLHLTSAEEQRQYERSEERQVLRGLQVAASLRSLRSTAQALVACHTPHFLGKADVTAPERHVDDKNLGANQQDSDQNQNQNQNQQDPLKIEVMSPVGAATPVKSAASANKSAKKSVRMSPYFTAGHF